MQLPPSSSIRPKDAIVVTAEPIALRSVRRSVEAVGTLHGYEELTLSAKTDGRVAKIHHDLASLVKPSDLLLEIDPTDAQLAVQQAERTVQAELAKWGFAKVPGDKEDLSILPTVVSARLKYELAQTRLQRMLALQKTNSVALEDVEQARSDSRVLESDWKNQLLLAQSAAATARLKQSELAIAQQKLRDTEIRVPKPTLFADGSDQFYAITERMVSEGTMLRVGTDVFKMILGKTLKLRLAVPELHSAKVAVGQHVEVLTSISETPTMGRVARISPAIDRSTRTFQVEVEIPNRDGALKPGGFAKASILTKVDENAATIPLAGLYSFAGIHKIFLVDREIAREIQVRLGQQSRDWIEIASPELPPGSQVITSGQKLLSDGMPISIRDRSTMGSGSTSLDSMPDNQSPTRRSSP